MAPRLRLLLLCLLLASCSPTALRTPPELIHDPALVLALNDLLCRVEPQCQRLRLQLLERPLEQAEMFPDGRLQLNIGLLLATDGEAEIAFVLAHETAHRRLRHRVAQTPADRTRLELAADADAEQRLRVAGLPAEAGLHLLVRLLGQTSEAHAGTVGNQGAQPTHSQALARAEMRQQAITQMQARIEALRARALTLNVASVPADSDWQRLLAPYRIKADALASPPSQNPPDGL